MIERRAWIEDELSSDDYDPPRMDEGKASLIRCDDTYPSVSRPIGFMRRKPRVRVKAWTMPILPK